MCQLIVFLGIFSILTIVKAQTDNCPSIKCDNFINNCVYTGMIKPDLNSNGVPILAGEHDLTGISVMVGCYSGPDPVDGVFPKDLIVPPPYDGNFTFNIKKAGPKTQLLQITAEYDIVTSMEISFISKVTNLKAKYV